MLDREKHLSCAKLFQPELINSLENTLQPSGYFRG